MTITLPRPEPKKTDHLDVPIDSDLKASLRKLAQDTGLSMAEICRRWISYGVEQSNRAGGQQEQERSA